MAKKCVNLEESQDIDVPKKFNMSRDVSFSAAGQLLEDGGIVR